MQVSRSAIATNRETYFLMNGLQQPGKYELNLHTSIEGINNLTEERRASGINMFYNII